MHTWDDDCEITVENILGNFDHYYLIHWIDYFVLTIILRDPYLAHLNSIMVELIGIFILVLI